MPFLVISKRPALSKKIEMLSLKRIKGIPTPHTATKTNNRKMSTIVTKKTTLNLNLPCGIVRQYSLDIKRNETYMRLHKKKCVQCRELDFNEIMDSGKRSMLASDSGKMRMGTASTKINNFGVTDDGALFIRE
jgi:hypothetical protein